MPFANSFGSVNYCIAFFHLEHQNHFSTSSFLRGYIIFISGCACAGDLEGVGKKLGPISTKSRERSAFSLISWPCLLAIPLSRGDAFKKNSNKFPLCAPDSTVWNFVN